MRFIAGTLAAAALITATAIAQPSPAPAAPDPVTQLSTDPLNTNAPFAFIMDGDNGIPLYSKNGDEPMVPASMPCWPPSCWAR